VTLARRLLTPGDPATAAVHDRLAPRHDVLAEAASPGDFMWAALADGPDPSAAHRALIGHGRLYLRGVFAFRDTGFATAYTLARHLLAAARDRGITRSHIWVETTGRERRIAELLGARTDPTPLHRFRLSVTPKSESLLDGNSGTLELPGGPPIDWIADRAATVLYGPPGSDGLPGPLPLDAVLALPWGELVATPFIEFAVPASDIPATLGLLGRGAKRVSRCPVLHGDAAAARP
jgi:hypothetical protein